MIQQNEPNSTSVISSDESSLKTIVDTTHLEIELQDAPTETTDVAQTTKISEPLTEALQIQICSESEKSEPQTTEDLIPSHQETEILKEDVLNEPVCTIEDSPVEPKEQSSNAVNAETDVVDSSTSQEEVITESEEKTSETAEPQEQLTEVEKIDKPITEAQTEHNDIPMDVDIVTESESKDKVAVDEPSSTSSDTNL